MSQLFKVNIYEQNSVYKLRAKGCATYDFPKKCLGFAIQKKYNKEIGFGSESFKDQVLFIASEDKLKPINMLLATKMADGSESSSKISVFVVNPIVSTGPMHVQKDEMKP